MVSASTAPFQPAGSLGMVAPQAEMLGAVRHGKREPQCVVVARGRSPGGTLPGHIARMGPPGLPDDVGQRPR